jgi:hypothetical protein
MSVGCRVNVNYTQSDQCEIMARVKEHLKNVEKDSRKKAQRIQEKTKK